MHSAVILVIALIFVCYGYRSTMTKCYGSGTSQDLTSDNSVTLTPSTAGSNFTTEETANEPKVTWAAESGKYYHFLMVDPDGMFYVF